MMSPLNSPLPRVLSIAGTDPTGGAGTAADLKSITAAGGYGMAVVTALVAQNTHGVREVHLPPADFLTAQLDAVGDDVELDAVKTGMLGSADTIRAVADWCRAHPPQVLVVDPVMVATSGDRLLEPEAEQALIGFCATAAVITPNIDELAVITGRAAATTEEEAIEQARGWAAANGVAVVVKTGHLGGREATSTWVSPDGSRIAVPSARVETTSTHGTGCSLASALATRLGAGDDPADALRWASDWLHEAIVHGGSLRVGSGNGPVDHSHRSRRLQAAGSADPWLSPDAVPATLQAPEDLGAPETERAGSGSGAAPQGDGSGPEAAVEAAGPWTRALWEAGKQTAAAIDDSMFVCALLDGSLSEREFSFYLGQDAHYLNGYSRALAALSARCDDAQDQLAWAQSSAECLTVEAELHRTWLGSRPEAAAVPPGPVTAAYTDFLLSRTLGGDRCVGAAAVLPCYWLYAQVGATLPEVDHEHPYAAWLETYRDPDFVTATRDALDRVERELAAASPATRAAAARAYLTACRHELEFFEQSRRLLR